MCFADGRLLLHTLKGIITVIVRVFEFYECQDYHHCYFEMQLLQLELRVLLLPYKKFCKQPQKRLFLLQLHPMCLSKLHVLTIW